MKLFDFLLPLKEPRPESPELERVSKALSGRLEIVDDEAGVVQGEGRRHRHRNLRENVCGRLPSRPPVSPRGCAREDRSKACL